MNGLVLLGYMAALALGICFGWGLRERQYDRDCEDRDEAESIVDELNRACDGTD